MAEQPAKRWVLIRMLHGAVERTEDQIRELQAGGLFVRDASGPDDHHDAPQDAPKPAVPVSPAPPAAVAKPAA